MVNNQDHTVTLKPLSGTGYYTVFQNGILDFVMPILSGTEWKIFSFMIRQTIGWQKDTDDLSLSQIQDGTGIRSKNTTQKGVNGLEDKGLVLSRQNYIENPDPNKDRIYFATSYRINRGYELVVDKDDLKSKANNEINFSTENPRSKNDLPPRSKNDLPLGQKMTPQNKVLKKDTTNTNSIELVFNEFENSFSHAEIEILRKVLNGSIDDLRNHLLDCQYTPEQLDKIVELEPLLRELDGKTNLSRKTTPKVVDKFKNYVDSPPAYKVYAKHIGLNGNKFTNTPFHAKREERWAFADVKDTDFMIQVLDDAPSRWNKLNTDWVLDYTKRKVLPSQNGNGKGGKHDERKLEFIRTADDIKQETERRRANGQIIEV